MLVVDPWHWLDANGELSTENTSLRRQTLRVARVIEYGGSLDPLQSRETLVECRRRPRGKPCLGLMWVTRTDADLIVAFCRVCGDEAMVISNWQTTMWAHGMMPGVSEEFFSQGSPPPGGGN
jgi:hypothetical protein